MKYGINEAGNLAFTIEGDDDRSDVQDMFDSASNKDIDFLCAILADWSANGALYQVNPEEIGALTDAPIVTNEVEYIDDECAVSSREVTGRVWWFPNYMVESFGETLLKTGTVTFVAAP